MAKSVLNAPQFQTEAAAFTYVEAKLWPDGAYCPHCGECERVGRLTGKTTRVGLHKCYSCKGQFTVRQGTTSGEPHLALHLWLPVMHLMCASKKGISTGQVQRMLDCSMKTAWFLTHRIREAMADDTVILGGGGGVIEADETFLGSDPKTFKTDKGWVGGSGQKKILAVVERGGRVRSQKLDSLQKPEIVRAMEIADRDSHLKTDSAQHYRRLGTEFLSHEMVDHTAQEYVRGDAHSNTIEGVFSIFKRGMRGIYQHCSEKHVQRYLAEFDFRYSNRIALGIDDTRRADRALTGVRGKRLTYETISRRWPTAEGRIVW